MITAKTMRHGRFLEPVPAQFYADTTSTPPTIELSPDYTMHEYALTFTGSHYQAEVSLETLANHVRYATQYLNPHSHAIRSTALGVLYPDPVSCPVPYQKITTALIYETRNLPPGPCRYLEARIRERLLPRLAESISFGIPYGLE